MLQAIVKKGIVISEEVPSPKVLAGSVLIKTLYSCISAGTEMNSVQNSGIPLYKKALQQPENVKKVFESIKNKGVTKVIQKIKGEINSGKPIGYSLSGIVVEVGKGVENIAIGDHVTASGAGLANHAEYVTVPVNLVTKISPDMNLEEASTVTLGAIALQGIRRADLRLGEFAVVFGTGIIGLLSIQMLVNAGIRVAAIDLNDKRLELAKGFGAELTLNPENVDIINEVNNWSNGHGADAVLFTAATNSDGPLSVSFKLCRKKGRVVLVGVSGMNINRADIYQKELDFLISTSYGPGRYDNNYEKKGLEYPYPYVRWTENRNMQEYLRLIYTGKVNVKKLIDKVYDISHVTEAYNSLKSKERPLVVLLKYNQNEESQFLGKTIINQTIKVQDDTVNVAIVGAGSFAINMHLPNLLNLKSKYKIYAVVDNKGFQAKKVAAQFGAVYASANYEEVLKDKNIDLVMITTRHDAHAEMVLEALRAGKHVFVEKPLAINEEQLDKIKKFYNDNKVKPVLMVGFNRRFSKFATEIKKHTDKRINPLFIHYRMNVGFINKSHWVHDNGGRIIGEGCHIIDLMNYFTGSEIMQISFDSLSPATDKYSDTDNKSMILKYNDGSICVVDYFAVGSKQFGKEFMEVHFDGKTIILDDYKKIKGYGIKIKEIETKTSQKGQFEELLDLHAVLTGEKEKWPVELWDLIQTTEISFIVTH